MNIDVIWIKWYYSSYFYLWMIHGIFSVNKLFKEYIMLKKYLKNTPILILLFLAACATKPESDMDTPEYHYKAGMRAIENGDYQQAIKSFQRSVDLDK